MKFHNFIHAFIGIIMCSAMTAWAADSISSADANDPTKERYCDPTVNADLLAKISGFETQQKALSSSHPDFMKLQLKISRAARKLQCTYRPIQETND